MPVYRPPLLSSGSRGSPWSSIRHDSTAPVASSNAG
jgi:hypothetical protein